MKSYLYITVFHVLACVVLGQRVAPGVPPQHYVRPLLMGLNHHTRNHVLSFIYSKNRSTINNPHSLSISSNSNLHNNSNLHISSNNSTSSHHHHSSNIIKRHIINLLKLKYRRNSTFLSNKTKATSNRNMTTVTGISSLFSAEMSKTKKRKCYIESIEHVAYFYIDTTFQTYC